MIFTNEDTIEITEHVDSISLNSPDGQEITVTTTRMHGQYMVTLYVNDGINVSMVEVPRFYFDQMMAHIRPLH